MIRDLKAKKIVDSFDCFWVARPNDDLCARIVWFGNVADFLAQLLHRFDPRRRSVMDEHRDGEVAVAEHCGNACQVCPDRIAAGAISGVVGGYGNRASVSVKVEMVPGQLVAKTHAFIAPLIDRFMVMALRVVAMRRRRGA